MNATFTYVIIVVAIAIAHKELRQVVVEWGHGS